MRNSVLQYINNIEDYKTVIDAITGEKQEFAEEEASNLLAIYAKGAVNMFGFEAEVLVKAVLALDVPGANLLDKSDAGALTALSELCKDWEPTLEKAATVKEIALSGDVSAPLSLALARAALDTYASQSDLAKYREEIKALSEFLKLADEEMFSDACAFLIRVRERVR